MDAVFLVGYIALPLLAYWRSRSLAWTLIVIAASVSVFGVGVSFMIDHGHAWTRIQLQWVLLVALLVVPLLAFLRPAQRDAPMRRQVLTILVPTILIGLFIVNMWMRWTETPGFLTPVSFLMGHSNAEDNAKWLDFAGQYASGAPIVQGVPMGGPLQLFLVFVGTLMGVQSQVMLGGYNEVAVAANAVVFGEFLMVIIAPLALAPLAEAWFRRPVPSGDGRRARIPWPLIWLGALVLVTANLIATAYGHLTFQYTVMIAALWCTAYLADSKVPRARLLTSLVVAAGMTVWVPLNVMAVVLLIGWLVVLVARGVREGWRAADPIGIVLVLVIAIGIYQPVKSSLAFLFATAGESASGAVGGGVHAVMAAVVAPTLGFLHLGIDESSLFAAGGGTEQTGPILAILAAAAVLAAAFVASRQSASRTEYTRLLAVVMLAGYAITITVLDQWSTGAGPHYGAMKFTFMTSMVLLGVCVPVAILLADPSSGRMTLPRWAALGGRPPTAAVVTRDPVRQPRQLLVAGRRQGQGAADDRLEPGRMRLPAAGRQGAVGAAQVRAVASAAGVLVHEAPRRPLRYGCHGPAARGLAATRVAHQHARMGRGLHRPAGDARVGQEQADDPSRRRQQRDRPRDAAEPPRPLSAVRGQDT